MSTPASPTTTDPGTAAELPDGGAYATYTLVMLILAYVLAFMDRQALNLLVEPIKHDLHLSDLQISLLQGLSFALFLSGGGLFVGRLIDTGPRTRLLATAVGAWSLMTGLCCLARSFPALFLCRIGVGIGEAAMTPAAYSLIGDRFPARRLGVAMSLYGTGPYIGSGLVLLLGGWALHRLPAVSIVASLPIHNWQVVFLVLGPAGLLVGMWVATLKEPLRRGVGAETRPGWAETRAYFTRNAVAVVAVNLAVGFAAMAMSGLAAWAPSLLVRGFGLSLTAAGQALGWRTLAFGVAGALTAGVLGDGLRRAGRPWGRLAVLIAASAAAAPLALFATQAKDPATALCALGPLQFLLSLAIASGPALLQEITPNRFRGLQHAGAVLASNLMGLGLGPLAVAAMVDLVLRDEHTLGLALALTVPVMLALSAASGLAALNPYAASLRRETVA